MVSIAVRAGLIGLGASETRKGPETQSKTVFRAFSLMSERGESNPKSSTRNPLSEKDLGSDDGDKSVKSQCLEVSDCQMMASEDGNLRRVVGLWKQLPDDLRNTITMLLDAWERAATDSPNE